jgi:hypothetical protein
MAAKRIIKLLGEPTQNEDGVAGEAITPGMLVSGVTTIVKHASAAGITPVAIALEREEMGQDIDTDYAINDVVKVGVFPPGTRFLGWIASGQNLAIGAICESAGDGTFRVRSSGHTLAKCLEATGAVVENTRVRFEAM